ncbi:Creatinase/aminopeptidase [Sparassis latifolia]
MAREEEDVVSDEDVNSLWRTDDVPAPQYQSPHNSNRSKHSKQSSHHSKPETASKHSYNSGSIHYMNPTIPPATRSPSDHIYSNPLPPAGTNSRSNTFKSNITKSSGNSRDKSRRPRLYPSESSSTLVGSLLERKVNDNDPIPPRLDSTGRLEALRELMRKENLDYYVVPTEDAHGSEYVAVNDKRREWISGFTGSAGQAIISQTNAYLIADSRYWIQAREQIDRNWELVKAGAPRQPADWVEWIASLRDEVRIGIDARMIPHETASKLNSILQPKKSKLVYPPQNLVDLIWREKPSRSRNPIFVQTIEFSGREASAKLSEVRRWIREQPPSVPSYSKSEPKPSQMQVGMLLSNLSDIAYLLNLRGDDIPFNPVFHSYLFVGFDTTVLFIEQAKITEAVESYLESIAVERRDYNDLWTFLRRKQWGEGKIIISPKTSYAISLMLTSFNYTVLEPYVEHMKSIKNQTELDGLRRAYLRDGAAFVRWFAWLEHKMGQGYDITEYEAAWRLTEFRRLNKHYMGLAYENISASGPNAALPHYSPRKATARMIDRNTPYLNDSGGQYRDGTCDTTRTVHFGRPSEEQCVAYTRVLQGHIAIDSAIFPAGTSGTQLDVLARKTLWQDGMNYGHGTGHGVGAFLNVHEGPQGFSSTTPFVPGHVLTNEPGIYKEGHWGMRIESALFVKKVRTKNERPGDTWLGFERLTCVPIQTRMVKDEMLTRDERQWLKIHNRRCYELLEPYLRDDKRALKWLQREAERGIGLAKAPAGISIDWD